MGEFVEIFAQSLQEHYRAVEMVRQGISIARAGGGTGALLEALETLRLIRGGLENSIKMALRIDSSDSRTLLAFYAEVSLPAEIAALEEAMEHVNVSKDLDEARRLSALIGRKSL